MALAQALLDLDAEPRRAARASARVAAERAARLRRRDVARTRRARDAAASSRKLLRALPATREAARAATRPPRARCSARLRDSVLLAPRTPFNAQVGAQRSFATASLPLDEVKRVARGFGVSLNDVVMAMCAGALAQLLLAKRDALPREPLVAAMPVSLREAGDTETNNQVSMVQCPLATDVADPVERLRAIHAATAQIKAARRRVPRPDPDRLSRPRRAAVGQRAEPAVGARARRGATAAARERRDLQRARPAGAAVPRRRALAHNYPVSIVTHGLALNITVKAMPATSSSACIACKDVVPDPTAMARGLRRALEGAGRQDSRMSTRKRAAAPPRRSPPLTPPSKLLLALEGRAVFEWAALALSLAAAAAGAARRRPSGAGAAGPRRRRRQHVADARVPRAAAATTRIRGSSVSTSGRATTSCAGSSSACASCKTPRAQGQPGRLVARRRDGARARGARCRERVR